MTEDQKAKQMILEVLRARRLPATREWVEVELRLACRCNDALSLLEQLEVLELVEARSDALGVKRWVITEAGKRALDDF